MLTEVANKIFFLSIFILLHLISFRSFCQDLFPSSKIKPINLSKNHIQAATRDRQIIINFDTISGDSRFGGQNPNDLVKWKFHIIDEKDVQIDSVWWGWGEGNQSPWPSKTMPLYNAKGYQKWEEEGVNIAEIFLKESHQRGIEAFYNYRINGSDNDLGPFRKIPMKLKNPDWLIHTWPGPVGLWNFAIPEVRQHKLNILREIAESLNYDGISLDFARACPVLPPGKGWVNRDKITQFLREFRLITEAVARKRGRPLLVGVRIPENLEGCHFDGLDIESWIKEKLVDILALGIRNFDVDLAAFRRLTEGTHVRIYPSIDDHHASDGYATPPIEIYRGIATNWLKNGADGIQTFNFNHAPDFPFQNVWKTHLQAYREIGRLETLKYKDKIFVLQRRGGGHGPTVIPNPEDWHTPRWMYSNTNMFAPLPVKLNNTSGIDTFLHLSIEDDLLSDKSQLNSVFLKMLLSDNLARTSPVNQRLITVKIATIGHPKGVLLNIPPNKGIEDLIQVRLNNLYLGKPIIRKGWLLFPRIPPEFFAVGKNLIGISLSKSRRRQKDQIMIEKLEVHVQYKAQ